MRKLFTLLILLFFWAGSSFGQITIGTGTASNGIPVYPYFGYSYSQSLYLQSQITVSGNITTLQFYFSGTSLSNSNNWTIYMGHTSKTAFASTTDWIPVANMTQVYSGVFTSPTTSGWITFDITDFAYNNVDNLVIAVDENAASYNTSSDFFYSTTSTTGRSIRYYSDSNNPDPAAPPTASGLISAFPNVILGGISLPSCTTPVNQPTALVLTPLTTSVSGTFTAAAGSDSYLVVRTPDGVLTAPPVDGTTYTVGGTLGNGTVVSTGGTSFSATGLTAGTLYYFHVFSKNAICAGGPLYLTTSPLIGSTTTAPNAPASIAAVAFSGSQIDLTTVANTAGNNIMIAWNTVNTFGTPTGTYNPGDPITGGGTVLNTAAAGTSNHTGLIQGTQYFYRAWSIAGGLYSSTNVNANAITLCSSAYTAPYTQNFDGAQDPDPCWTKAKGQLLAPTTLTGTTSFWLKDDWRNIVTGDRAQKINIYSTARYEWLFTPQIDLGTGTYQLEFDLALNAYGGSNPPATTGVDDKFAVVISTDGGTTWTSVNTLRLWDNAGSTYVYNSINPAGERIIIPLTGYTGVIKIGFYGESTVSNADNDLMINNMAIVAPPACSIPLGLFASSVTNNAANIGWTDATTVEIDYAVGAHTAGTGTIVPNVTANPYGLTGLTSNSTYYVYVRQNCGAGNLSAWAGPVIFTTLCDPTTAINENFDAVTAPALPSCWSKYISPAFSFETVNTYTTAPNSAPNCVQLYSSGASLAIDAPLLISPQLSNLGAGTHQLKFYAKGASTNLSVIVGTMSDPLNAATFTPFQTVSGLNTSTWTSVIVSFAAYSGSDQYIAIAHPLTTTYSYIYLDDVVWETLPACPQPSTLTATTITGSSAVLGWNANGTTAWEIEWGLSGFVQGTGTTVTGVTNPYTLSGLAPTTAYSFYVRANCGAGGYSLWTGPVSFTTTVACPTPTALTASGILATQASLGWTNPGGTLWDIEWGPSGFVQGTGTVVSASTNPYVLTGLTANTAYSWYVRQNCGSSQSTWAGPNTFTTACNAVTVPFGPETFEVAVPPSCWTRYTGLLAAPSTLTTTTSGWVQDDFRNVTSPVNKAAKLNIWSTTTKYWLMTPQINLGAGSSTLRLEFDLSLNAYGTSTAPTPSPDDRFAVVISTDGGITWTSANTLREWNNTGSTYVYDNINFSAGEHVIIPLAGYSGTVMIGFYGESTVSNGDNDLMIDNVAVQEPPACSAPTAIVASAITTTTATISWTAASPAPSNGYQWEVRTSGAGGSGATGLVSSGSTGAGIVTANVTGLTAATIYSVYVRSSCGGALYSTWTGPTTFTTLCNVSATPFTEDFEATTFPPLCWTKTASPTWIRTTSASGYGAGTGSAEANFYGISSTTPFDLVTFSFDMTGLATPTLKFDYAYAAYIDEVDQMNVLYSTDNGATYTLLLAMPGGPSGILNTGGATTGSFVPTASQWATQSLALPAGTNKVKFTAISAYGNNLYLDNVKVFSPLALDAAAVSIDLNSVVAAGSVTPLATVKNEGTSVATFNATLTIGAYTSTQTVTALAAGTTQQVTFAPWTAVIGDYTATLTTALAGDLNPANNSVSKAIKVLNLNKQVYGYNAYANLGTDPEGPTTFNLSSPGVLNSLADQSTLNFVSGGTWAEGVWYGSVYNTAAPYDFITLDPTTGARTLLGTQTVGINGLSYNRANSTMYGVAYDGVNSNLYSINMTNGAITLIGSCGARLLINLAINTAGVAYAVDLGADVLGTINLTTGAFTSVGPIGFDANYAQDMEFDRETGELYMAAQDANSGWLAWVNQTTGAALKIGDFEGGAEITGLAIPYTSVPPTKTINLTGVMLEGLYAGGGTMNQANDDLGPKFGPGIADVITVELHNASDYFTVEHTATGVELSTTGTATITGIPAALSGNYRITIKHRNSVETTTASAVSFAGTIINQSFALPANVYGGNLLLMMDMGYAIYGGDVTQDGYVDTGDVTVIDNDQFNFTVGYVDSDVNGDGFTDTGDVTIVDNNQFNFVGAILP